MSSKRWWRRPVVIVPTAIVAVTVLTLALAAFQPWRLFIDVTVDEALPSVAVEESVEPSSDASAQEAAGEANQDASADSNAEEQSATETNTNSNSGADSAADSTANSGDDASAEPSVEENPEADCHGRRHVYLPRTLNGGQGAHHHSRRWQPGPSARGFGYR